MAPPSALSMAMSLVAIGASTVSADCVSYGMDFQNGGSYFQNSLSNENFTFVSQFEGCKSDTAFNVFVDNTGEQSLCSDTKLQPDNTDMLSTCPDPKNQLALGNGEYSVIVFSNNGDGDSIAYQRDFSLSVGPQSTSTYTPTVVVPTTSYPIINITSTVYSVTTTTLPPVSVTSPSLTVTPTSTYTPARVTTATTKALLTIKDIQYTPFIVQKTKTATASCKLPTRATRDPRAYIKPTVGPWAKIFGNLHLGARRIPTDAEKARFVQDRSERLRLEKRAPDPQPLVVTDTNTNDWVTSTSTETGAAVTNTVPSEILSTATVTPAPVVVVAGKTTAAIKVVTAPTPTKTWTIIALATLVKTTKTFTTTMTITSTTTPAAVASSCKAAGGVLQ